MARSSIVKSWDEAYVKLVAMLNAGVRSNGRYFRSVVTDAAQTIVNTAGDETSLPSSGNVIVIPRTPILTTVNINLGGSNDDALFTANVPPGMGLRVAITEELSVTCESGGAQGQVFDIMKDYDFSAATAELYVKNLSGSPEKLYRGIYDKGDLKGRKAYANVEKTLQISQTYQHGEIGFIDFCNIDYAMQVLRKDDRGELTTEEFLYYGCFHDRPIPSEQDGDNDTESSFDIRYEAFASIAG